MRRLLVGVTFVGLCVTMAACSFGGHSVSAERPPRSTTTTTTVPPTTTTTTTATTMALPTTTVCVENPAAQQWATQAHDDFLTGLAANQRLDQEDPTSAAYNNNYLQVQNAELAMSNDLTQLHAADNCGQYLSFQADS